MELQGRQLRRRRYELGRTLEEVAKRAEISFSSLSKMERGIHGAHPATLPKLAKALDMEVNDFLATMVAERAA